MNQMGIDFGREDAIIAFYSGKQYLFWQRSVWYKPWTWNRSWGKWVM